MEAGALVWSVRIDCEMNLRRRIFEGDLQMAVIRPKEAQQVAQNLQFTLQIIFITAMLPMSA
jgi:hypothetical protein